MKFSTVLKEPSAFLPVGMSLAAFVLVLAHLVMFGSVREADEGTLAHLFQLLMITQLPIMAFFAITWLPRSPRRALQILVLQACAMLAAFVPVYVFGL